MSDPRPPGLLGGLRSRADRVLALPAVVATQRVLDRFNSAGGGLLGGGLAYAALFAIVPAVLLVAGVVGLVATDPADRAELIETIVGIAPPLRELIEVVLTEAVRDAAPVSILGAIALIWGTSRFIVAFQDAMARVMGGDKARGLLASNLAALGAVVLMIVAIPAMTVLTGILAFLEAGRDLGLIQIVGGIMPIAFGVLPILVTIAATILVYRVVPVPSPPWRAVVIPGVAVGVVLVVLARVFAFVAPRLIGAAALLGTLATVFAALAWLALSFQAILLGAAWVRDRAERVTPPGAKEIEV